MKITVDKTFNIKGILECGQAFRYRALSPNTYELIACGKRLRVHQFKDIVTLNCSTKMYNRLWKTFFDMETDYNDLQKALVDIDDRLKAFIDLEPGIRLLLQEPFEMMITFILSQNKAMPQIKSLVNQLAKTFGTEIEDGEGSYYAFPTSNQLANVTEAEFRALKVGFRAPYLVDAIAKVNSGQINLIDLASMSTEKARNQLLQVKGIGRKVADCILLFGYHKMDVFPLDVWMKRGMKALYFEDEKVSDQVMLEKAQSMFGDLGGIAQQYIFNGMVNNPG